MSTSAAESIPPGPQPAGTVPPPSPGYPGSQYSVPQYSVPPSGAAVPARPKPPRPPVVARAFQTMIGGAVLSFAEMFLVTGVLAHRAPQDAGLGITAGFVAVGLWLMTAFGCREGRVWARPVGAVLFGLRILTAPVAVAFMVAFQHIAALGVAVFDLVQILLGLCAVILFSRAQSTWFFRASRYRPPAPHPSGPVPDPLVAGAPLPAPADRAAPNDPWNAVPGRSFEPSENRGGEPEGPPAR